MYKTVSDHKSGKMKMFLTIITFLVVEGAFSQKITSFNDNWHFIKKSDTTNQEWTPVSVPHTWNSQDAFDKVPGYYRGIGWYKKSFRLKRNEKRQFLTFEGVNQEAFVYVNGKLAGTHLGGYTAFHVEISDFLNADGNNKLTVQVDNSHNPAIPPLKGDFNFYGGIYRDVWLSQKRDIHFDFSELGDRGIFIRSLEVSKESASIANKAVIHNQSNKVQKITLTHILFDNNGNQINKSKKSIKLEAGLSAVSSEFSEISNPNLWHPDNPYLYRLVSEIRLENEIIDTQSNLVGFRWFRFDADSGFYLNGKPLKLMGTNRHQDYENLGNALSDDRHREDVKLIKEMGSNFFRTAHYPQDPSVIDEADKQGLIVSMEIPLDHEITDSPDFLNNSKRMMQEMIRQNFNHPSILIWAYMNEMMLGRKYERDKDIIEKIRLQAIELEKLTRDEDPDRYTMIPNHGDLDLYIQSGLTEIPMIVGWNLYFGWYEADEYGAGKFLDRFHELVPDKPALITEYGAGADPRIRSLDPKRFDFSIEWQNRFHQNNLKQYTERRYLSGAAIWNVADFGSESRNDADPKINSKGVLGMDRTPKDAFYLYQSWLKKDPVIRIGERNWNQRIIRDGESHPISVYSNAKEVELFLNGKSLGKKMVVENIARWEVPWKAGKNVLEATMNINGDSHQDWVEINVGVLKPNKTNWDGGIHINCGATFTFNDPIDQTVWLSDAVYQDGIFGFKGGVLFSPRDRGVGSDRTIMGTNNDPIYQTARVSPERYEFDVKPGSYEVTFHWSELESEYQNEDNKRVFDVLINGNKLIKGLNIYKEAGFANAYSKRVIASVDSKKLIITFNKKSGNPIIQGLQIRRIN